jgi:hypothetical protein
VEPYLQVALAVEEALRELVEVSQCKDEPQLDQAVQVD